MADMYIEDATWRGLGYRSPGQYRRSPDGKSPFSPENPYYKQMVYESDRRLRQALQQQAQDWEASNQQFWLSRDLALEDRAHEEYYNSPLHQQILQQQAGAGSSSGSSSSGSGTSFVPTDSDPVPVPHQVESSRIDGTLTDQELSRAGNIFDMGQSIASTAMTALNFASGVSTFDTDVSQAQANLYNSQLSNDYLAARNQSAPRLFSASADSSEAQLQGFYYNRAALDAKSLFTYDDQGTLYSPTEEDFNRLTSSVPEPYRESYLSRLKAFGADPSLLDYTLEARRRFNKNAAFSDYEGRSGFLESYVGLSYRSEVSRLRASEAASDVSSSLNSALLALNYGSTQARAMDAAATASASQSNLDAQVADASVSAGIPQAAASDTSAQLRYSRKVVEDSISNFDRSMKLLADEVIGIDRAIGDIESKPDKNSQDEATLAALRIHRLQIVASGNSRIGETLSALRSFAKASAMYDATRSLEATGHGYEFARTGPAGIPEYSDTLNSDKRWVSLTFDDYVEGGGSNTGKDILKKLISVVF